MWSFLGCLFCFPDWQFHSLFSICNFLSKNQRKKYRYSMFIRFDSRCHTVFFQQRFWDCKYTSELWNNGYCWNNNSIVIKFIVLTLSLKIMIFECIIKARNHVDVNINIVYIFFFKSKCGSSFLPQETKLKYLCNHEQRWKCSITSRRNVINFLFIFMMIMSLD